MRMKAKWCALQGSNLRPHPCEGCALLISIAITANILPIGRVTNPKRDSRSRHQEWPYIRFSETENAWKVDARTKHGGTRRFFRTRVEAETFAQQCRVQKQNSGTSTFGNAELAKFGKTVHHAIEFYLLHLRAQAHSISAEQAVTELLSARRAAGRDEQYCRDMGLRLNRFARDHKGAIVASITTRVLDKWLADLDLAASSRNTYRRDLQTLFSFCEKHGYCPTNPAAKTERATNIDGPPEILNPAEAIGLLNASGDDTRPYLVIGLFAGLRRSELQKLDWSEIDLASGQIEVTAAKAKTKKRRLVPISKNLDTWIRPLAKTAGPIIPKGLRKRLNAVKIRAGIAWPRNALRHSYGSYRLAQCHDVARVSLEMGNSPQIVFAHYRELVKPSDAERFWALIPGKEI